MAAGQGFKTFTTGEVLTAGDVNGYLMQGINVFTNATARDAAITAPAEGQFAFTKDNNSLWYYDGAAWVASGATGDIEGVTAGVGISGGGTSGTVTVTNSMATAIDAKGDLVPGTGADTFARLAVGANGTVLTADSAEATGLKWAAAASGGGMTVLASGNLATGTGTTTLSSISTAYNDLRLIVRNLNGSGNNVYTVRVNGDTGANYASNVVGYGDSTAINRGLSGQTSFNAFDVAFVNGDNSNELVYDFYDYANTTTRKLIKTYGTFRNANTADNAVMNGLGGYSGANAAITSISVTYASNVNGGTYILYGVK